MSPLDPKRRVVVTGLGVVSSIGIGWEEFWKNLLAGKSGISKVDAFDTKDCNSNIAGEVKNFKFNLSTKTLGRASKFAILATELALVDAKINVRKFLNEKCVICIGTTNAENNILEALGQDFYRTMKNPEYISIFQSLPSNILSNCIAEFFKINGLNFVFGTACSSGNCAISMGYDLINNKIANYAIVGGVDGLSRITYTGFDRVYAIASQKCQPFDLNRQGMIPGEGAGILFIESLESAENRNAKIYGEIIGYGMSCDGIHMTNPDYKSIAKALKKSLINSNLDYTSIDYISAHGTGTIENDKAECKAIFDVFSDFTKNIPVSSIKSMLGHTMGAASAIEAITCCLTVTFGQIPPTINFELSDPECNIDCVPNKCRTKKVHLALNNSQAFGGNNVCIVLRAI